MKVGFLFCFVILFNSCAQTISKNDKSLNTSANFESDQNLNSGKQTLKDWLKTKEIERIQNSKQEHKQYLRKEIAELSKAGGLSILENSEIQKDDLEVRVWRDSAWWKTWAFILKRSGGKWTADFQKLIFKSGTRKLKKIYKRKLIEPKSGWENFWRRLENERILTLPDGSENGGDDPCPDCGAFIIETYVGGNYRFYLYTEPYPQSEIPEVQQIAKISDIISEEFTLKEFNAFEPPE